MNESQLDEAAGQPLDEIDLALLASLRDSAQRFDAPPVELSERLKFAVALDEVFAEVATMTRESGLAGVRSQVRPTDNQTLTFASERLTAMVSTRRALGGGVRLDGWVAPAGNLRVVVRCQEDTQETLTDEHGRFVFDDLPAGLAQLAFYDQAAGSEALVVTPTFQL